MEMNAQFPSTSSFKEFTKHVHNQRFSPPIKPDFRAVENRFVDLVLHPTSKMIKHPSNDCSKYAYDEQMTKTGSEKTKLLVITLKNSSGKQQVNQENKMKVTTGVEEPDLITW